MNDSVAGMGDGFWRNPVLRRYWVARCRLWPVLIRGLLIQLVAGFVWSVGFLAVCRVNQRGYELEIGSERWFEDLERVGASAATVAWLGVLVLQGLILILKGTFSVAVGMARESHEGMIDGIRLSPVSVMKKVSGQLFGLPSREWVLAASLLPWAFLSWWLGGLNVVAMAKVYLILVTSAVFHHAIGMVSGMVIPQKILAGTLSQVLVIVLHLVVPWFGQLGLGPLAHIPIEGPVIQEMLKQIPDDQAAVLRLNEGDLLPEKVRFFRWLLDPLGYNWTVTLLLLGFLCWVQARRWRDAESQLLGKWGTVVLAACLLLLGTGELLPKLEIDGFRGLWEGLTGGNRRAGSVELLIAAAAWASVLGSVFAVVGIVLIYGMTPSRHLREQTRRRIRQAGARRIPWMADGRSSWAAWFVLVGMLGGAWVILTRGVSDAPDTLGLLTLRREGEIRLLLGLAIPLAAWHALLIRFGWKVALPVGLVAGFVPLMVAILALLAGAGLDGWVKQVAVLSGLALPGMAAIDAWSVPLAEAGLPSVKGVTDASLMIHAVLAVVMGIDAWRLGLRGRKESGDSPPMENPLVRKG